MAPACDRGTADGCFDCGSSDPHEDNRNGFSDALRRTFATKNHHTDRIVVRCLIVWYVLRSVVVL